MGNELRVAQGFNGKDIKKGSSRPRVGEFEQQSSI